MDSSRFKTVAVLAIVGGAVGWVGLGTSLKSSGALEHRPNVLHLNGSPYGRTLAYAMRGPADIFWHRGQTHEFEHGPEEEEHEEDHGTEQVAALEGEDAQKLIKAKMDILVAEYEEHEAHEHEEHPRRPVRVGEGPRTFALDAIDWMRESYYTRNNDREETLLHKAYILGETEKRLSVSYHMDPTNLACYGSYFLFLSEALARVEGEDGEADLINQRQDGALSLANYTIKYCLNYWDEAPAVLTAAVAAHDSLQILFSRPDHDLAQLTELLKVLDGSVARFEEIRAQMQADGTWVNFPEPRIQEMEKGYTLVKVARKGDHELFKRVRSAKQVSGSGLHPVGTGSP